MSKPLLVNAAELLRRPGSERAVELQTDGRRARASPTRRVRARRDGRRVACGWSRSPTASSSTATVRAPWAGTCRRCLAPAAGDVVADVHELYQQAVTDPDAFEIVGDQLDLRADGPRERSCSTPRSRRCAGTTAPGCARRAGIDRNVGRAATASVADRPIHVGTRSSQLKANLAATSSRNRRAGSR